MGKCLVTKLKNVVDNNNLKKLGEIILSIDPERAALAGELVWVVFWNKEKVTVTSTFPLKDGDGSVVVPANTPTEVAAGQYSLRLPGSEVGSNAKVSILGGKYNLTQITFSCLDDSFTLDDIKYNTLTNHLGLRQCACVMNFDDLNTDFIKNVKSIEIYACLGVTGNVTSFIQSAGINSLLVLNTNVTGSVESAVEKLYSMEKRAGSFLIGTSTRMSFNNVIVVNHNYRADFTSNGVTLYETNGVAQTGGTIVATYDGTSWTYA